MPWYRVMQLLIMALGILAGAIRFGKLSQSSKWLLILLIITFFNELASWYLAQTVQTNYIISYFATTFDIRSDSVARKSSRKSDTSKYITVNYTFSGTILYVLNI